MSESNNTGHRSTGDGSTGDGSTGYWSISDYSTGHFSTIDYDGFGSFNKKCSPQEWIDADKPSFLYFNLTEWIHESNMSSEEREANPSYKVTGGYLKKYEYKEAFKKSWDKASKEDQQKVFTLPNFDAEIFKQISGIDVTGNDKTDKIEELAKAQQELLDKANEIQKQIEGLK